MSDGGQAVSSPMLRVIPITHVTGDPLRIVGEPYYCQKVESMGNPPVKTASSCAYSF